MEKEARIFVSRLLAHQWLSRNDPGAKRALTDEAFREEIDNRLAGCGLRLLENPFAEHVAIGMDPSMDQAVFGHREVWMSDNLRLDKGAMALLVILWALIILPKRQRQIERQDLQDNPDQISMFQEERPLLQGREVSAPINRITLMADFGDKLGRTKMNMNLSILSRLGFITQRKDEIYEGPLLDLALDYNTLAGRILDGALTDLLGKHLADVIPKQQEQNGEENEGVEDV
jgi:hypothetical protein